MNKPTWDPINKKLSGHYDYNNVRVIFTGLEAIELEERRKDPTFEFNMMHLNAFTLKLARMLGLRPRNYAEVPYAIRKWVARTYKIYTTPLLFKAYSDGAISMRYLYDLADYAGSVEARLQNLIYQAVSQKISNTQFRNLIKESK